MSDDESTRMFQEKPDWKGKLKGLFQKGRADTTDFFRQPTRSGQEVSPLSEDSNAPLVADPSYGGQSLPPQDRTITALVRMHWNQKIKPHLPFSKGSGKPSAPFAPSSPPPSGPKITANHLNGLALFASLLLVAWTTADLAAFFIDQWIPAPPASRIRGGGFDSSSSKPFADYQVIINRNLFSSLGRIPGEEAPVQVEQDNDPVKTGLPLALIGTVILKNELRSVATLEDKGANQVFPVRVDDELPGKIKILSVEAYKVVFRNLSNGRKEYVDMPEEGNAPRISVGSLSSRTPPPRGGEGIEQTSPNNFQIARTELDKHMANINEVLTQARAIPHFENGQPAGFKLVQIVPGSVYEKLGLKNGDVLKGVNGEPVDAAKALEMMSSLKSASQLELTVQRDGRTSNMSYQFR
jgi:general secretion pathway protein C